MDANDPVMVVSPYVVAEVDCLVATRKGVDAELAVLAELSGGAYELASMDAEDVVAARTSEPKTPTTGEPATWH